MFLGEIARCTFFYAFYNFNVRFKSEYQKVESPGVTSFVSIREKKEKEKAWEKYTFFSKDVGLEIKQVDEGN